MIIDLRQIPSATEIDAEICIIGGGVAGLLIAREFVGTTTQVVVLEAGGRTADEELQDFCRGEICARSFRGFQEGRARVLGGASTLWGGQCIPLDDIDFTARPWVPDSGWPLTKADLAPWYRRAMTLFGINNAAFDTPAWQAFGLAPVAFDPDRLSSVQGVFMSQPNLAERFGKELTQATNVKIILHANAERIDAGLDGRLVRRVNARSIDGRCCGIRTNTAILCAGGIDNARLLLLSDQPHPNGLGNARGLVGCYFQDHVCGRAGTIHTADPRFIQDHWNMLYGRGMNFLPKIALSEAAQRREQVVGCVARMEYEYPEGSGMQALRDLTRAIREARRPAIIAQGARIMRDAASIVDVGWRYTRRGLSPAVAPKAIFLEVFAEQAPRRDNRVQLGSSRDRLGLRRAAIDWHVSALDRHTMTVFARAVRDEFKRLGLGTVTPADWVENPTITLPEHVVDSFHHAGTTRMADDPERGVVDRDTAVWGVEGLYIAGSSVFPSSGVANPTLTIAALALRLASHLKSRAMERVPPRRRLMAAGTPAI